MTLTVTPLHKNFAAKLGGVSLCADMDAAELAEIRAALAEYAVCAVDHDQPLSSEDHIGFSTLLGPVEGRSLFNLSGVTNERRISQQEIIDQSNMDETGEIYADDDRRWGVKLANRLWHTDISFHPQVFQHLQKIPTIRLIQEL